MSSKASRIPGEKDRLRKHSLNLKQLEALIRLRDTARPVLPTKFSGGSPAGSTGGGTGNFLSTTGGTMTGNIAFEPKVIAVSDGRVNLDPGGNPPDNSSYILVTGQGTPDDIKFIDGAERNGQYLIYQGTNQQVQNIINANILTLTNIVGDGITTVTVTLSDTGTLQNGDSINVLSTDNFNLNGAIIDNLVVDTSFTYERVEGASTTPESSGLIQDGNILTADGSTLVLDGTLSLLNVPVVTLIFDVTVSGGGIWRVISSPKFPSSATLRLQADQASDGVVAFDDNNIVGAGIVDEGNGIFRLRDVAYTIDTHLRIMTSTASGGGLSFQWEQADDLAFTVNVSNVGTEGFVFSVNENDSSSSQPFCSAEVDATLQDKFIRLFSTESANFEFIMASSSSTTIFSGGGGGGVAGGGTGGVSFPITPPVDVRGNVNTNQNITLTDADAHSTTLTLTGDIDITFSGFPTSGTQIEWEVEITQDGTGGHIITWPAEVTNPPVLDTDPDSISVVVFRTNDGGVTVRVGNTVTTTGGASTLSELGIDINKNWGGFGISNFGPLTGVTSIDLDGVAATIQGVANFNFFQAGHSLVSTTGQIAYNVADIDAHKFFANNVEIARFVEEAAGIYRLDMLNHTLKDAKDLRLDVNATFAIPGSIPGIGYDSITDELRNNAPDNAKHVWSTNNNELMGLTESQLTFLDGLKIQANPNGTNPGISVGQFAGDPASTTNADLWYNSTTNKLRTKENGVDVDVVNPVSGFASTELDNLGITSINADLIPQAGRLLGTDAAPWSDTTSNKFTLGTAGTFAASDNAIIADAATGLEYNTPVGDLHSFFFGNLKRIELNTSELKFVTGGQFESAGLILTDAGFPPVTTGEFRLDGSRLELEADEFALRHTSTVAGEFAEISAVKVDADPLADESIARFIGKNDDSGTIRNYGGLYVDTKLVADSGSTQMVVRANNSNSLAVGIQLDGDNDITGRSYATLNSIIRSDVGFGNEDGNGGTFNIRPDVNAGASTILGIVVQDNVSSTVGVNGMIAIPTQNLPTGGSLTKAVLDTAFGTHKGAMGWDEPTFSDGKLFVRNSNGDWYFFNQDGVITV